jgi:hypothetical protein
MLPDGLVALNDYEVLSVSEEGDEDVVRLRKRVDQAECQTDCLDYSGWSQSGTMECSNEDPPDTLEERSLVKRGRKSAKYVNAGIEVEEHASNIRKQPLRRNDDQR